MTFSQFFVSQWPWFILLGIMIFVLLILEWREKAHGLRILSMQEGIRLLNNKKALAIDVRPAEAFAKGHIAHSQNIKLSDLENQPEQFIKKKEQPLLLICEHNTQASKIGKILKSKGYTDIHLLEGGLSTWRKENLPLERNSD